MKKKIMTTMLIVGTLIGTYTSYAADGSKSCGLVGKITTANSIDINLKGENVHLYSAAAIVGMNELKSLTHEELTLLLAAKTNSLEVCVEVESDSGSTTGHRSINLK